RLGRLRAARMAPADPPLGPPLLLVYGLGGGMWGWENFQRRFAERGYLSYALELPGNGAADSRGDITVETYALHVAGALAQLGPCVVMGHSMGGLVAQKLAETEDQAGFVFLASSPPWHMLRPAYAPLWRHLFRHPWRQVIAPALGKTLLLDHSLQDHLVNRRLSPEVRES